MLIVCEGAKTEVIYFRRFLAQLRQSNIQLRIIGPECGSSPISVVEFAKEEMEQDEGIDICFCVFDRDSHTSFDHAIGEASRFDKEIGDRRFSTIKTYPSFEYWYILHFKYTRKPYVRSGKKSPGDSCVADLKKFIPEYGKADVASLAKLAGGELDARRRAAKGLAEAEATGELNPSTEVHLILEVFQGLLEG